MRYAFEAEIWRHAVGAGWCFVTLPAEAGAGVRALAGDRMAPFGSIRVRARLGDIEWGTSVFSDTRSGSFVLPIKSDVRARASVAAGDSVAIEVEVQL